MTAPLLLEPELLFDGSQLLRGQRLGVDGTGRVVPASTLPEGTALLRLPGKVLLPGWVNAHSHAFQRLIRGRTEFLAPGRARDDFWSWRERMYQAANALGPEDVYAASRQAFLEMALAGVTTVGEFHYLHHAPDGQRYADESELSLQVIRAAREVGLRIVLLRVGYARAGFNLPPNPLQRRFHDVDVATFLGATESLRAKTRADLAVTVGLAPHSVRAVPRAWLTEVARVKDTVIHMHVAEQSAEVEACEAESGLRPVDLLSDVGLLSPRFTAVHGIELNPAEMDRLGSAGASVCACPSTERNLGDGVVPVDLLRASGVRVCLGSDSQVEVDLLSEARLLEGNLRLMRKRRAVLDDGTSGPEALALRLLQSATCSGAESLGIPAGRLAPGEWADAVTLDLGHPSLAGFSLASGLAQLVFGASAGAVQDVFVAGRAVVQEGRHVLQEEIHTVFNQLTQRVFPNE